VTEAIRTFGELTAEERSSAGGKGGTLALLHQAGYPVPDGFVILPAAFEDERLKPEAWKQVQVHLARMREWAEEIAFAVRSSALSEDSALASFAGEFETVLDVHTDEMVREAIRTVRRSGQSERVKAYSEAKGMDEAHEIAVVVQRLVRADISGVLFTADPVTGGRQRMLGNYVYGLGDELVSGEAEPYTFTLDRPKGRYDGPADMKRFARGLYKLGCRLEKDLESPQDIEWAMAEDRLFLLQSRPITTLREYDPITQDWNTSFGGDYLWGDSLGIYPDVLTPSTWSVWLITWDRRIAGVPFAGNIGGRLYLNYSLAFALFGKMGRSREEIENTMTMMMGTPPEGVEVPQIPLTLRQILSQGSIKLLLKQQRLKKQASEFLADTRRRCQVLRQRIPSMDAAELITVWHEEVRPLFEDVYLLQDGTNDDYMYPYARLKKALVGQLGERDANALISTIGGTAERSPTVGISLGLVKVARGELSRDAYLEEYGHRHDNENELSAARPYEDPTWLDGQLAELEENPVDVEELLTRRAAEFDSAWEAFEQRHPRKAKSIRRMIDRVVAATFKREAIRSELTRSVGIVREWFLRAGEMIGVGEGVFFLTHQEVLDALAGDHEAMEYIPARREVYEKYKALPPYPAWIRGRFDPVQWASDPDRRQDVFDPLGTTPRAPDSGSITGYPGSAGRVEGLVRRIDSPEEGGQLQPGEILVAVTTNVGWTSLFPRAGAVVTDVGAPLAHAAIVARELGIPAVVGCGNATVRLTTGDRVLVDGSRGTVEILESE
jgi:phosphohistidine swiveling domain-containing protein